MFTIIYGIKTLPEALATARLNANGIGFNLSDLSIDQINDIISQLPQSTSTFVTSHSLQILDLENQCQQIRANVFHYGSHPDKISLTDVYHLKNKFPLLRFAQVIPVIDSFSIDIAKRYESIVDYLILDSFNIASGMLGTTGETHDWSISAKIVNSVKTNVILAGGLGPENVKAAINIVHPWGVATKTRTDKADGSGKDLEKVSVFLSQAKGA